MKHLFLLLFFAVLFSCKNDPTPTPTPTPTVPPVSEVEGFGVLEKVGGIWNGPVTSSTPLGNYPEWIVDFRPISTSQIAARNELDTLNDIFMSFFVVKHQNKYKVAFRNGGSFAGLKRVSYFAVDSVSETQNQSFYRFSEFVKGRVRAFTDVIRKGDSLKIYSYTNKYNTLTTPSLHMAWKAKLQNLDAYNSANATLSFPQKTTAIDFSAVFNGIPEAIFYNNSGDPYPESDYPYVGKCILNYSYAASLTPNPAIKTLMIITTQPLINGFTLQMENLKTRSRYVILAASDLDFTFQSMHPGSYYAYAVYDADGNMQLSSGDWVSAINTGFNVPSSGLINVSVQINFIIP
jgi:hypothetical protein